MSYTRVPVFSTSALVACGRVWCQVPLLFSETYFATFALTAIHLQSDKLDIEMTKHETDVRSTALVRIRPAEFFARVLSQQVSSFSIVYIYAASDALNLFNSEMTAFTNMRTWAIPRSAGADNSVRAAVHQRVHFAAGQLQREEAARQRIKAVKNCFWTR